MTPNSPPSPAAAAPPRQHWLARLLVRRRFYLLLQLLLTAAFGWAGIRAMDCYLDLLAGRQQASVAAVWNCMLGSGNASTAAQDPVPPRKQPPPAAASGPWLLFDSRTLEPAPPVYEDLNHLKADWYQQYGFVLKLALIFLMFTAFWFYDVYRKQRRSYILRQERALHPPLVWQPQPGNGAPLYSEARFQEAARQLQQAAAADAPGYLVLIEQRSPRDHQTMLFDQLVLELGRQAVPVTRYFYEGDPRICWHTRFESEVYLDTLARQHPDARLILIGTGEALFDPVTDERSGWTSVFAQWPVRVLATPRNPARWGRHEQELGSLFSVLPTTAEAFALLPALLEGGAAPPPQHWILQNPYPELPDTEGPQPELALQGYFDSRTERGALVRSPFSGQAEYHWLCACAVYPELSWNLTLALGEAFGERSSQLLIEPQRLFKLISLPWFQEGLIPEDIRLRLVDELDPEGLRLARETILRVVRQSPPPAGSYAAEEHRLRVAAQEAQLSGRLVQRLRLMLRAQDYALNHEIHDETLIRYLAQAPLPGLGWVWPGWLRQALFWQGIPALGLRTWARGALAVLCTLLLLATLDLARITRLYNFGGERYFLSTRQERMRFFNMAGARLAEAGQYEEARSLLEQSAALREQLGRRAYLAPDYNLAWIRWQTGDSAGALQRFDQIALAAESFGADSSQSAQGRRELERIASHARFNEGLLLAAAQEAVKAEAAFRAAAQADAPPPQALYAEAMILAEKGLRTQGNEQANKFSLAVERLDRIRRLDTTAFLASREALRPRVDELATRGNVDETARRGLDRILQVLDGQAPAAEPALVSDEAPEGISNAPEDLLYISDFSEGWALVKRGGKYGYIDEAGTLQEQLFDQAKPFSEGRAAVRTGGAWGYIDGSLRMLIRPAYEAAGDFRQGTAAVQSGGRWGLIGPEGQWVLPPRYDAAPEPEDRRKTPAGQRPLAVVSQNGTYLYADFSGAEAFPGQRFERAAPFEGAYARVSRWGVSYLIDRSGACVPASLPGRRCPAETWRADELPAAALAAMRTEAEAVAASPDGSYLAVGMASGMVQLAGPGGEQMRNALRHPAAVYALGFAPDSRLIATGCADSLVRVWSVDGALQRTFAQARGAIRTLAFSRDGRLLAAGGDDRVLYLWSVPEGRLLSTVRDAGGALTSLAFDPSGGRIAAGSEDGWIRIYSLDGQLQTRVPVRSVVLSIAFSPDGKRLAAGSRNPGIQVFGLQRTPVQPLYTLSGHSDWVSQVAFSPDGQYLLSASYDRSIRVWNAARETVLQLGFDFAVRAAAFTPDGERILAAVRGSSGRHRVHLYALSRY
ncbi:MAG: WG repeat-containing protein [Bacteroidia bacterium]|nr:WG repeat-containing protein [Bacteroidia bacterium]